MKNMKRTAVVLAVVMAVVIGSAEAGDKKFNFKVSGAFHSTPIDANGDGQTAVLFTAKGRSNLGRIHIQSVIEAVFFPGMPVKECPDGEPGFLFPIVRMSTAHQVKNKGFLFGEASGTFCFNQVTCFGPPPDFFIQEGCTFSLNVTCEIFDGTKRFAGATGSIEINGTNTLLLLDPMGNNFGAGTAEGEGMINIPGRDAEEEDDDDDDD